MTTCWLMTLFVNDYYNDYDNDYDNDNDNDNDKFNFLEYNAKYLKKKTYDHTWKVSLSLGYYPRASYACSAGVV